MTMVIQLDGSALDRLFPPGSEARTQLQAGVVNNFIDKMSHDKLSWKLTGLDAQIEKVTQKAIDEILHKQGAVFKKDYFGKTLTITDAAREELRTKIEREINDIIREKVDAIKPQVANEVKHRLDAVLTAQQQTGLSELVRKLVRDELKNVFNK